RSYNQYCGLALALDVIGERWSLLIVRELLEGRRRFNELLDGLPGIATNLLAERLRELEPRGVIEHGEDGRYALTPWGRGLRESIYALGRWAGPLMVERGDSAFRPETGNHAVAPAAKWAAPTPHIVSRVTAVSRMRGTRRIQEVAGHAGSGPSGRGFKSLAPRVAINRPAGSQPGHAFPAPDGST